MENIYRRFKLFTLYVRDTILIPFVYAYNLMVEEVQDHSSFRVVREP
jgi:hypothetical protein